MTIRQQTIVGGHEKCDKRNIPISIMDKYGNGMHVVSQIHITFQNIVLLVFCQYWEDGNGISNSFHFVSNIVKDRQ